MKLFMEIQRDNMTSLKRAQTTRNTMVSLQRTQTTRNTMTSLKSTQTNKIPNNHTGIKIQRDFITSQREFRQRKVPYLPKRVKAPPKNHANLPEKMTSEYASKKALMERYEDLSKETSQEK